MEYEVTFDPNGAKKATGLISSSILFLLQEDEVSVTISVSSCSIISSELDVKSVSLHVAKRFNFMAKLTCRVT